MAGRGLILLGLAYAVLGPSTVYAQAPLTFEQALTMSRERALRVAVACVRIDESKLSPRSRV